MRKLSVALVALLAGAIAYWTVAPAAAATIVRETVTTTSAFDGIPHDCRPGVTGSIESTEVWDTQRVETETGFHFTGTITGSLRIDWSDGTHSVGEWTDHFAFNAAAKGATVFTLAHVDSGNTYSAEGDFLFRITFHLAEHITVTDGDVTRVDFDRGRLHVFGNC